MCSAHLACAARGGRAERVGAPFADSRGVPLLLRVNVSEDLFFLPESVSGNDDDEEGAKQACCACCHRCIDHSCPPTKSSGAAQSNSSGIGLLPHGGEESGLSSQAGLSQGGLHPDSSHRITPTLLPQTAGRPGKPNAHNSTTHSRQRALTQPFEGCCHWRVHRVSPCTHKHTLTSCVFRWGANTTLAACTGRGSPHSGTNSD